MTDRFPDRLRQVASDVQDALAGLLDDTTLAGETERPAALMAAMRHGVLTGGKRLRPFLVIETARLFGADGPGVMRVAAALECLHGYSLIHDDLPAMDDDDMRRGQPSVHRAFDEATAILAGDALLTFAFDILAEPETHADAGVRALLVLKLARAAGHGGMIGGQYFDLNAQDSQAGEAHIRRLQSMKTGALIRFACEAGCIIAGAGEADRTNFTAFGERIGLAFQLADDLLDVTADAKTLGKATGKDAGRGKRTLVGLYGIEGAQRRLANLVTEAEQCLETYGEPASTLRQTARYIAQRTH